MQIGTHAEMDMESERYSGTEAYNVQKNMNNIGERRLPQRSCTMTGSTTGPEASTSDGNGCSRMASVAILMGVTQNAREGTRHTRLHRCGHGRQNLKMQQRKEKKKKMQV